MDFFRRLFKPSPKTQEEPDLAILTGTGDFALEVVGESYYQKNLEEICGPRTDKSVKQYETAFLFLEDNNPHDKNAVRVEICGKQVGYLNKDVAKQYRQQIKAAGMPRANGQCQAVIRGGWKRIDGGEGKYGVWLDIPVNEN